MIINKPVLFLNRNWQAINVRPLRRALTLVWNDYAKIVDTDTYAQYSWDDWTQLKPNIDEQYLQCIGIRLKIPEVITLASYDKVPVSSVAFNRRNLFKRDHYICQYCGNQLDPQELTIDHILARSRGGESSWENCVLACISCNAKKGSRTLKESGLSLIKEPVRPKWRPFYNHQSCCKSWSKFISEVYWNVGLK